MSVAFQTHFSFASLLQSLLNSFYAVSGTIVPEFFACSKVVMSLYMKASLSGYIILGSCSLSSRILGQNFSGKVWDPVWFFSPWYFYSHVKDSLFLKSSCIINWLSNVCYFNCLPSPSNYLPHFLFLFRKKTETQHWAGAPAPSSCAYFWLHTSSYPLCHMNFQLPFSWAPFFWVIMPTFFSSLKTLFFLLSCSTYKLLLVPHPPLLLPYHQTH